MRLPTAGLLVLSLALAAPARLPAAEEYPSEARPAPKPPPKTAKPPKPPKPAEAPAGELRIEVGKQQPLELPGGTQVICDDASIAHAEFTADAIVLAGVKPGTTDCGARLNGSVKGFWKVTVVEAGK